MGWYWRFVDWQNSLRHDWIFLAFVGLATALFGVTGAHKHRLNQAMAGFALCLADSEATCAAEKLELARSIDPASVRVRLAQAELQLLLHDPVAAEGTLVELFNVSPASSIHGQSLAQHEPIVRAEALLAVGDLAAERRDFARAEARWTEAASAVDSRLITQRRARLERLKEERRTHDADELTGLRTDFEKLLDLAQADSIDEYNARMVGLLLRISRIPNVSAQEKLRGAISASQRAAFLAHRRALINAARDEYRTTGRYTYDREERSPLAYGWMGSQYQANRVDRQQLITSDDLVNDNALLRIESSLPVALNEARRLVDLGLELASSGNESIHD